MRCRAMSLVSMTLAVTVTLCSRTARADAVAPEPTDCPAGTTAGTCHGGPHCSPTTCVDSSTCKNGTTCREVKWCIGKISCAGRWRFDAAPPQHEIYEGTCEGGATCGTGTCMALKVCAAESSTAPDRGCSCAVASASSIDRAPGWLALCLVVAALWRRNRGS